MEKRKNLEPRTFVRVSENFVKNLCTKTYLLSDSFALDPFFPGAVNDGIRIFGVPGFDLTTEGLTSPVATFSARSFFAVVKTGAKGPINSKKTYCSKLLRYDFETIS